jgi:hypothetical protein
MEPYNAQDGARVKADGVIVKPFEATDLTAAVDRIAEKVKPVKAAADSARGIKIVEKQPDIAVAGAGVQPALEESGMSEPAQPEEKPYDKTVRVNAAHIQTMLQQGPGMNEAAAAIESSLQQAGSSAPPSVSDFHAGPAHELEIETFQDASNFESEPEAKPAEPSIPSFMSQYLPEPQEEKAPAESPAASLGTPLHEQPTGAFPIHNELLHSQPHTEIHGDRRRRDGDEVSALPELELTAAPPVPDAPVANEPGLELTRQASASSTEIVRDPALETDPHRSTMDFPTRFGTSEADLANQFLESLQHPTDNSAAPVDEFEARLNAAMESYETTSIPLPGDSASPNADLLKAASHFETESTAPADSFEAQVEAAMHGFDVQSPVEQPEAAPEIVPAPTLEVEPEPATEVHSAEFQAFVVEMPVRHIESHSIDVTTSSSANGESEPATHESEILAPETDDAVIQQMREGLSHHPVEAPHSESSEAAPRAMAVAAGAVAPSAPPSLAKDAEAEIGRAMAAAVGSEVAPNQPEQPNAMAEPAASAHDSNHLAGAVESVMKRELPNLIWKIMAELDLRKRS